MGACFVYQPSILNFAFNFFYFISLSLPGRGGDASVFWLIVLLLLKLSKRDCFFYGGGEGYSKLMKFILIIANLIMFLRKATLPRWSIACWFPLFPVADIICDFTVAAFGLYISVCWFQLPYGSKFFPLYKLVGYMFLSTQSFRFAFQ